MAAPIAVWVLMAQVCIPQSPDCRLVMDCDPARPQVECLVTEDPQDCLREVRDRLQLRFGRTYLPRFECDKRDVDYE